VRFARYGTQHRTEGGSRGGVRTLEPSARLRSYVLEAYLNLRHAVIAGIAATLVLAVAPVLLGWYSTVVVSGSMAPGIRPGDVVVARPVAHGTTARVAPGTVVLVDNPAVPGELLMHRLLHYDGKGQMILKGDANAAQDSTPVPSKNLRGVASLRIPYAGLPYFWIREGQYLPAVAAAALLVIVMAWLPHRYDVSGAATSRVLRRHRRAGGRHRARPIG
jgi:signal peptidase